MHPLGWVKMLYLFLSLKKEGHTWIAPECKSWIWICSSVSRRSVDDWRGNETKRFVEDANRTCYRIAFLLLLSEPLDILSVIEQPASTFLRKVPLWDDFEG